MHVSWSYGGVIRVNGTGAGARGVVGMDKNLLLLAYYVAPARAAGVNCGNVGDVFFHFTTIKTPEYFLTNSFYDPNNLDTMALATRFQAGSWADRLDAALFLFGVVL